MEYNKHNEKALLSNGSSFIGIDLWRPGVPSSLQEDKIDWWSWCSCHICVDFFLSLMITIGIKVWFLSVINGSVWLANYA